MSGFCGIFGTDQSPDRGSQLAAMTQRLCRRPSADCATAEFDLAMLGVGWAFPAEPLGGAFAVWNETRTVFLLIAGDEFAVGNADPKSVLAEYEKSGPARCVAALNGWFCGLLVDTRTGTSTLFNDRYGLARIHIHETSTGGLAFATEAKALLAAFPKLRSIDERSAAEHAALGCVLQNRTLFRDLHLLPPGSLWTFHANGTVERRHYFRPDEWENQERLSVSTYLSRLREVFGRVARRYHTADHPTGLSLTGGLDSRAVIAWTRADPGTMPCYTFGGPYRDCADVRIARELAQLCKQPHTTIRISDEFFAHFDVLAERAVDVSDGTMDVTGAVELYVNSLASGIAPVRLTGNYGSEIIRSNVALRPSRLDRRCYTPEFCALMDEAVATYEAERRCRTLTFIAFKQVPWHHYARFAVERSEILPRSPFLDNELVALAYQAPEELGTGPLPMLDLIAGGNSVLAGVSTDRAFRAGRAAIVTKMANSWQEFTVKAEYAYDYGMPQWLARADRTVSRLHLERLFLGRHKFYHFRVWYRDQLGRYVRERLAQAPDERFGYRAGAMQSIVAEHLSGRANHTLALHKALTASLVEDLFLHQR